MLNWKDWMSWMLWKGVVQWEVTVITCSKSQRLRRHWVSNNCNWRSSTADSKSKGKKLLMSPLENVQMQKCNVSMFYIKYDLVLWSSAALMFDVSVSWVEMEVGGCRHCIKKLLIDHLTPLDSYLLMTSSITDIYILECWFDQPVFCSLTPLSLWVL